MNEEQGLSLLDIAPATEKVQIGAKSVAVYGVSAHGIVSIFRRFPELQRWFMPGSKINLNQLIVEAPDAIAAVIAAGCGSPGNAAAEETAGNLPVETQLDILEAIGRLTFKNGFGPFVQRIVRLAAVAESENYGRAPVMKSQPQSKPVSQPGTTPKPSGS